MNYKGSVMVKVEINCYGRPLNHIAFCLQVEEPIRNNSVFLVTAIGISFFAYHYIT